MNTIIISGNISAVKVEESKGKKYAHFSIKHSIRKADGSYSHGYLPMTAFDALAERLAKFKQGSPLEFVAHFNFSSYTDKDGKTKYNHDVVVDSFSVAGNGAYIDKKGDIEEKAE